VFTKVDFGLTVGRTVVIGQIKMRYAHIEGTTKHRALVSKRMIRTEVMPKT
jgi:hypothetical protein